MNVRWAILIAGDALLAVAAVAVAVRIWFAGQVKPLELFAGNVGIPVLFTAAMLFSSYLMETYDHGDSGRKREILIKIILASATAFFFLSILYYLDPTFTIGEGLLVLSLVCFATLQFGWHLVYLVSHKHPRLARRVLILGTGPLASQVGELVERSDLHHLLAGYVVCDSETAVPVVQRELIRGKASDLMEAARQVDADTIVVALSERRGVFPLRDVLRCKLNGLEVLDAPTYYELVNRKLMLDQITPSWFIFSSGFRRTSFFSYCKRLIDIVLSVGGLAVTLPFLPVIALLIKLDSPGPLFFRQVRVGNREKKFLLFKLRTMRADAEQETGAVWAQENDPRITRLGSFLRNSRIDEIPQLYNVLRGDMSFVGPRPERPEFVEKLKEVIPYYSKRHFIKPGVTGWAQVRYPYGASVEDSVEKLRFDLYYIKNLSPFIDTLIFFETIKVVLFGRGGR
jgi:sugar transferase (PEP-CTERM system associated)